jgi:ATP-dependent DNA helicase RecQ
MLEGSEAFAALARALRGEQSLETHFADPAFERLRIAVRNQDASPVDLAVLIRHALRYESLERGWDVNIDTDLVDAVYLRKAGLNVNQTDQRCSMTAEPWRPRWLPDAAVVASDEGAMRAERKRFHTEDVIEGDPFLVQFGLKGYRSVGQRSAVRAALGMPPRSTLIIDLPTGEGKSLVFQAVQKIGFADMPPGSGKGLTVVIVPTVTLALDHERSCGGSPTSPMAYVGGQTQRNAKILQAIRSGEQELVVAAPEAVVGPLRSAIGKVLENDGLRAIVVDEAHLVEGWGTGFRTEFQTFAGLYHQWRSNPENPKSFRLIFLSATYSELAKATLKELFSPDEDIPVVSAASIRPEPEYWIANSTYSDDRESRVVEALLHLPRPAILYVTKVKDAEYWHQHLKENIGFGRVRKLHGGTRANERESVLKAWSEGTLDLVVATSAFGLGIDYPHVRTIIHACVPEKIDRFYQEVGRGGRDGCTSISLLVPAHGDENVAKSLSQQKIISVDRGYQRWKAMFESQSRLDLDVLTYGVRLDTAPSNSPEDIDLIGERSIDWNARLLSMMARCGMIQLVGIPSVEVELGEKHPPYQGVRIHEDGHMLIEVWRDIFEKRRGEISAANAYSFGLLKNLMLGDECPAELIRRLYPGCAHNCTSCRNCRLDPSRRRRSHIVGEVPLPWPYAPEISEAVNIEFGTTRRLMVEYGDKMPKGIRTRDFEKTLRRLDLSGFRVSICIGNLPDWITGTLDKVLADRPWLLVKDREWRRPLWPTGHSIIFSGPNVKVRSDQLNIGTAQFAEMVFIPEGLRDSENPERKVADMLIVPSLNIREFFERYLR